MSDPTTYSERVWLNRTESPSTGSVCAFDGLVKMHNDTRRETFLEVSSCHSIASLHRTPNDSMEDFIAKVRLLAATATEFANHLETVKEN